MAVGGIAEIVEVGTTGVVSASGDWAGLGDGVVKLLSNPERMKQMGQAARKRVEESFDLQESIHLISTLFRRILGHRVSKEDLLQSSWPLTKRENRVVLEVDPSTIFPKRR
jgi:hypothetical protein